MEYLRNIRANNYQRRPTRWAQPTWARQAPLARPGGLWPSRPTFGAHLLVYKSFFDLEKIRQRLSGWSAAVSRRNLGRSTFALWWSDSAEGTSFPEGGNHRHHHHQQLSHLGEGNLHQHLHQHHLISNPSSSLVFNLVTGTIDCC